MTRQGLYIHIPFCKSRCIYCDFYSTTFGEQMQKQFVGALANEARIRQGYLPVKELDSVYLGGGTPSVLSETCMQGVFDIIHSHFSIKSDAEVTVEVNPNDVTPKLIESLVNNGVNRISMGIQSFDDKMLKVLRRRHTAAEALKAVDTIVEGGISNISIDLIYGLPHQTLDDWSKELDQALSLPINHMSAYSLMYEEGTPLYKMREQGLVNETDDQTSALMFLTLMQRMRKQGFDHYEISNFGLPGKHARHNSGYWNGMLYMGLGAGAHSYDVVSRQYNVPDVKAYVSAYGAERPNPEEAISREVLTKEQRQEECIMTSLRTAVGIDLRLYARLFGQGELRQLIERAKPLLSDGRLIFTRDHHNTFASQGDGITMPHNFDKGNEPGYIALPATSIFVSDDIISDMF